MAEGYWMVPFQENPQFVEREDFLGRISQMLDGERGDKRAALYGLGGTG